MAEEGEDAAAMLSAPETLSEEEQDELRRELAKVRAILCALPCGFPGALGKRLRTIEGIMSLQNLGSQWGRGEKE